METVNFRRNRSAATLGTLILTNIIKLYTFGCSLNTNIGTDIVLITMRYITLRRHDNISVGTGFLCYDSCKNKMFENTKNMVKIPLIFIDPSNIF